VSIWVAFSAFVAFVLWLFQPFVALSAFRWLFQPFVAFSALFIYKKIKLVGIEIFETQK